MKKLLSFTLIMIIMTILFSTVAYNFSYANEEDITKPILDNSKDADTTKVTELGGKVVGVIQAVGTVVAIVMLLVVGITYLTKSPEGKAEYKKSMGNYIIGALLIFGAATVVNMLYSVANGLD